MTSKYPFTGSPFTVGSMRSYPWYRAPQVWRALLKFFAVVAIFFFFAGMYFMWQLEGKPVQECPKPTIMEKVK